MCLEERANDEERYAHTHGGNEKRDLAPEEVDEEEHKECCRDDLDDSINP